MTESAHAASSFERMPVHHPKTVHPQGVFGALIPEIRRAVAAEGYVTPTPIQEQCIPHLLAGRDLMGTAQTGTGKTAAFALPLLQLLSAEPYRQTRGTPRALILAPTRELAAQIGASIGTYGRYLRLSHTVIFGGVNQARQVLALSRGIDILVATPGRLLDLMGQGYVHLDRVEVFILDEVDRMLDMGFIPDIRRVLAKVPPKRQTLFFSATMPPDIVQLAGTMVKNPVRVAISPEHLAVELIAQKVMFVDKGNKDVLLVSLLGDTGITKVLVFTRMKHTANKVVKKLLSHGIQSAAIHGNKSQSIRTKTLDEFRQGRLRVLVATDLAARGLDVDDITHVINYDLPMEAETYVHRIGRTARAGAGGDAISFCSSEERAYLRDIERLLGDSIPVDKEQPYHCEASFRSSLPAPTNFGRGGAGRSSRSPRSRITVHGGRSPSTRR
jgi:ATP-dependent RNA helicase RhlE